LPDAQQFETFFTSRALEDLAYWRRTDPRISERIERLLADMVVQPFSGLGKPEPLRHQLAGYWSRRITKEHRIVYRVAGNTIFIAQCRFHYR
jgi:toxin YoeB